MEAVMMNGVNSSLSTHKNVPGPSGIGAINGFHEPTLEELERELPVVYDGQVPLGDLLSRVAQSIYAELCELAETLPNMSDVARKRTMAEWVVKVKKQVVKLYAVVKWARDADTVQKAMNITAFLMNQNQQFLDAINALSYAKESLDPARLRNHDLLTSLDVLTTGSYRRLPTVIKKAIIPTPPLTDDEVSTILIDMEDTIRYRLRMTEIIPVEMSQYRVAHGRVHFHVSKLFEASLCLRGGQKDDGWFFVHAEFLFTVGGDLTGMQEFPRKPSGMMKRHLADEADARLAYYLPLPADQPPPPPGVEVPPRPQLPEGTVDAPLVRVFNFLQMMSISYQLEILCYQAQRMCSLGWADYLKVEMSQDRKSLAVSYWTRKPPPHIPNRPPPQSKLKLPLLGGTLTISIVQHNSNTPGGGPARSAKDRILAQLQERSKLGTEAGFEGGLRPSDGVEGLKFAVKWESMKGALGVVISPEDAVMYEGELAVDPDDLDLESILRKVIEKHTRAILKVFQLQLQRGPVRTVFSPPGEVVLVEDDGLLALQVHLCADEIVIVTIEPRTGKLSLKDTGDLAAAGRGPRFSAISEKLNENPTMLLEALVRLRLNTITDLAEQKANYLGLQSFRHRNFSKEELQKLGPAARGTLYIQLSRFPNHYLVLVITDEEFRYALISVEVLTDTMYANMVMKDIGWLDVKKIHGEDAVVVAPQRIGGEKVERDTERTAATSFNLETQVLRELYAYCCARVAFTRVENQLKLRGIPCTTVMPTRGLYTSNDLAYMQSSLARSVPSLCVQSSDILSGAPAAEAAMPNIRVIPLNWWSDKKAQVVTCVKLKYVQQPMGKRAGSSRIIRPSKRIIYDTTEAVVSFLSENVDKCVDEFLEEWARVSKMVVIAREVAQMAKERQWRDVRLLSFDLQTVEFAYSGDYTVSLTCTDQLSPSGGSYDLRFSRSNCPPMSDHFNPHNDSEPFMRNMLRHGRLTQSLHRLVAQLRDTLPIVVELEAIRRRGETERWNVDTFPKAAGWYRLLYGDLRHALDFRLMSNHRVVILDASHSLFASATQEQTTPNQRSSSRPASLPPSKSTTTTLSHSTYSALVLRPIPGFRDLVQDVVKGIARSGEPIVYGRQQLAAVDVGVVCDVSLVPLVARALHERVVQVLNVGSS
ncbi:hypothetical protein JAAARDRAFT_39281 [Jaapia argillacea MUCL 33604]|uniref:Mediator of RNA polymerase II transcription subunit 14 n=1 Tax=Jaapia argillacea MUCL 33604 TaxID=933084 RepID=A0A067PTB4_9AGAM|nr:hypothetical protein JAAARDRAFT_39281 [Jaapia argillacea MUCL 33604]